jgi:DNA-directed RNA polymerase subunit RPC12/RpoP
LKSAQICPFCKVSIEAPEPSAGSSLFTAVETEVKEIPPENADVLCQEDSVAYLPEVVYQSRCPSCEKNIQVEVLELDLQCHCVGDAKTLLKINGYATFRVTKPEALNLRETRGLRDFLKGPEAAQAQYFFKVTHENHIHAFCSRCGGPVMITFHGLITSQETFEFTCRHCGKHGIFKREPMDFEDKPLIESMRKNP